jgi:subtilisin family serine protease
LADLTVEKVNKFKLLPCLVLLLVTIFLKIVSFELSFKFDNCMGSKIDSLKYQIIKIMIVANKFVYQSIFIFCCLAVIILLPACTSDNDSSGTTTTPSTPSTEACQVNDNITPSDAVNVDLTTYQWYLNNTGQSAFASTAGTTNKDINQTSGTNKGDGITVAIIDTGLEIFHEDLSPNVVSGGSWDFECNDNNPTNIYSTSGDHGTSVAGLVSAADNGKGGRGVAPEAELKGFNLLQDATVQNYIDSVGGSMSSPISNDVDIFNLSFGYTNTSDIAVDSTIEAQFKYGVENLRGGKGAIYVKSAGNGFNSFGNANCSSASAIDVSCQNANMDPESALPYIIVVGATNADGEKSSYSTAGSNLLISAPGGEYGYDSAVAGSGYTAAEAYEPAMITTDQMGCDRGYSNTVDDAVNELQDNNNGLNPNCDYTSTFNGTSSAAPVLSGAIALMLNENENAALTWRDVRHILITTAVKSPLTADHGEVNVNLTGGSYTVEDTWVTNAAGHKFHNWYGFGQLDVDAAVSAVGSYSTDLGTFVETGWESTTDIDDSVIEDYKTSGGSDIITFGTALTIETVQIKISVSHPYIGDLGIELTSPAGTRSILLNARNGFSSADLSDMVLTSNAFYGETSNGNWTVKVVDTAFFDTGTLDSWSIRVFGH